jgi:hypothetical protein
MNCSGIDKHDSVYPIQGNLEELAVLLLGIRLQVANPAHTYRRILPF